MEVAELLRKVRKIELKTRLSQQVFAGQYHASVKGKGMHFDHVRAYAPGDDTRSMDWNVTARTNEPYIKVFTEERELTLFIAVDLSASSNFGTRGMLKSELVTEIAAVLAWSAMTNNDKTGVLFFSDRLEKLIPPAKGRIHILRIISELLSTTSLYPGTSILKALDYIPKILSKRSSVFLISDFLDAGFEKTLRALAKRHEVKAIRVYDMLEQSLPNVGLIHTADSENGQLKLIDTSSKRQREDYALRWKTRTEALHEQFAHAGVPLMDIRTDESYFQPLLRLMQGFSKKA